MASVSDPTVQPAHARIAVISLHTSPLDQPGTGDSGGMNVEIRALSQGLADRGVAVDVYTRCAGRGVPEVDRVGPLTQVIQVPAGPCAPVGKGDLPGLVPTFVDSVVARAEAEGPYDLVHAHYWLSGRAAAVAKARWGVPLVASFHTLGQVKNLADGIEAPEPAVRLDGEREAVLAAERILVPTRQEAANLAGLYGAEPARIRVVPPGVDAERFRPVNREEAKASLGLSGRVAMFLGRLQPLKGPDVAIRAVAEARRLAPDTTEDLTLAVVGGPSGQDGQAFVSGLRRLAADQGIGDRVRFLEPRPHEDLPAVYSAAEVLLMPSRTESFGLAALEAQACGVPVVAAAVGGLRSVVAHGTSGFLVPGHHPGPYAAHLVEILEDPSVAGRLSAAAREHASAFSWDQAAAGVLDAYAELIPEVLAPSRAS
jgi:D-inositol-3-phosphate glycosyltransferase